MNRLTMKKGVLGVLLFLAATAVFAQKPTGTLAGFDELAVDVPLAHRDTMRAGPTLEEVGDADSFGNEQTYLGLAVTRGVAIQADCTGWPPAAGVCIEHAAPPGLTNVDERNLATIELPKKATDSILCFTFTQFTTWSWVNDTGSPQTGIMSLFLTVQVENDALIGLSNPSGDPYNGFLFLDNAGAPRPIGVPISMTEKTLPDGAYEFQQNGRTRSCTAGIFSANLLRAWGLTDRQIKDFFDEPMTITFGVGGSVSMTDFVNIAGGIRLYGDD